MNIFLKFCNVFGRKKKRNTIVSVNKIIAKDSWSTSVDRQSPMNENIFNLNIDYCLASPKYISMPVVSCAIRWWRAMDRVGADVPEKSYPPIILPGDKIFLPILCVTNYFTAIINIHVKSIFVILIVFTVLIVKQCWSHEIRLSFIITPLSRARWRMEIRKSILFNVTSLLGY